MAVLATGNTFATGDQVTAATLNAAVNSATFASGAVDGSTTQLSGGAIIVKDGGITTGKLSATTGSGSVVLATSPTLVTPVLGTPSSGNLASCTGYVGTSTLVTTGALNSGSITSGFGTIDVGADSITGGAFACTTITPSAEIISAKSGYITTADFTKTTDTTLANITGLSATVTAGATYIVRAVLHLSTTQTGGYKFAISGTCTATSIGGSGCTLPGANALVLDADNFTALNETFSSISTTGVTVAKHICDFAIVVNAGGTLTIQFAQDNPVNTSTVLARSFMTVTRIA